MNWVNYSSVLAQLQASGLLVEEPIEVGYRKRCHVDDDREKRGWYHLHELHLDVGGSLLVGSYGVWRGNDPGSQRIALDKRQALSDEQRVALATRVKTDQKAAAVERAQTAERAAARAAAMWARLSPSGDSDYLTRKGVAPHGVRFSESGSMVLPLLDAHSKIHGLQVIYPSTHAKRKRLGRDKDFWPKGLAKQGHFFLIGTPAAGGVCLVAEGYATAATVHEATGLPVAVAFDAGNLVHVVAALVTRWPNLRVLVCADDDYLGKCRECNQLTPTGETICRHCGQEHRATNAGITGAQAAALASGGNWLAPHFATPQPLDRKGHTDFNDLHLAEGLHVVRRQLETLITALNLRLPAGRAPSPTAHGAGGDDGGDLKSVGLLDELMDRYALVYEASDTVFDSYERALVPLSSMRNLCAGRQLHRWWLESADKRVVRLSEVGFDPAERDPQIKCNLWSGWPTQPQAGSCEKLLALGEYLCSADTQARADMWTWLQRWLAFPIQHPGAKMKTAAIVHGPQGTGKSVFFETICDIYGRYGRVLNQAAVEDKHNDWASKLLFAIADEMVSRDEVYHVKNLIKGLITGRTIRVNPKNVAAHDEVNHVNLVFLSNEALPSALERDDRRHAVIWTPPKWPAPLMNAVWAELQAGGAAALHHHLLHLDLGDFGPATEPPMTEAKRDLIELGMDSSERFYIEWTERHTPLPLAACRTEDLYQGYRHWCTLQGVGKPAQLSTCMGTWKKRPGVTVQRERHYKNHSQQLLTQSMVIYPPAAPRLTTPLELSNAINVFNETLRDWREASQAEQRPKAAPRRDAGQAEPPAGHPAAAGAGDDDAPF